MIGALPRERALAELQEAGRRVGRAGPRVDTAHGQLRREGTAVGRGRRFDDAEAALVFRRAAELAHPEPGERPQLDAAALA